jgi:hypothetical protein
MGAPWIAEKDNVVEEDEHENADEIMQHIIHQGLVRWSAEIMQHIIHQAFHQGLVRWSSREKLGMVQLSSQCRKEQAPARASS